MFPPKDRVTICFAHVAYLLQDQFEWRHTGIDSFEVRTTDDLARYIGKADVVVVSGLWRNELLESAQKLRFIQSIGAGTDQFDKQALKQRSIRLASAQGVNSRAVSEHVMALILALARRLPEARDNQGKHVWRGLISDLAEREDELTGKVLLIFGLGGIGCRLAHLAKAFGMHVIGVKRDPSKGGEAADSVHGFGEFKTLLPQADFVALTCSLTPETENVMDAEAFAHMKKSAYLINAARGRCVDQPALIKALKDRTMAGAGLDVTVGEPLPPSSPLWDFPNVLITPHSAGETRRYEENVLDILMDNLERLWRGEQTLRNEVV